MSHDARELLERFVAAVESGQVPGDADLADLAAAFNHILAGDDPKKALGLAGAKGRPKGGSCYEEHKIVEAVITGQKSIHETGIPRATFYRWRKKHEDLIVSIHALLAEGDQQEAATASIKKDLAGYNRVIEALEHFTNKQILEFARLVKDAPPSQFNEFVRNLEAYVDSQKS